MKVYSVYDSKAGAFLQPWFAENNAVAIRSFTDIVSRVSSPEQPNPFYTHCADYTLFAIGTWEEHQGILVGIDAKEALGLAQDYLDKGNDRG